MKKFRLICVILLIALVLTACGDTGSKKDSNWDREAKAMECIAGFNNAATVEEMDKFTTGMSQEDKQLMETMLQMGAVAKIASVQFVEVYKGLDIFTAAYRTEDGALLAQVGIMGLERHGNKYLISADTSLQETLNARYTDCACNAGTSYEPTDTCTTCNGTGSVDEETLYKFLNPDNSETSDQISIDEATGQITIGGNTYHFVTPESGSDVISISPIDPNSQVVEPTIKMETITINPDGSVESMIVNPNLYGDYSLTLGNCPVCFGTGCLSYEEKSCGDCNGLGILINK